MAPAPGNLPQEMQEQGHKHAKWFSEGKKDEDRKRHAAETSETIGECDGLSTKMSSCVLGNVTFFTDVTVDNN